MGHNICAIIGKNSISKDKIMEFGLAAAFEKEFAIIILDFDIVWELKSKYDLSVDSTSDYIEWDCELSHFIAREIGMEKYGIIQTDYFGGIGEQCASLYIEGIISISEKSINTILTELGVKCEGGLDEFDSINLGEYRQSEYYYWKDHNWADRKENMIAGQLSNQ